MSDNKLSGLPFDPEQMIAMHKMFMQNHPGFLDYQFEVVEISGRKASMRLPYNEKFVGDRATGSIHGGIITLLMDTAGGLCSMASIGKMTALATLDLRMDYLRPTTRGLDIIAEVECYHLTNTASFVRGIAYEEGEEKHAVAHMAAAFMLNTKGPELVNKPRFSDVDGGK
ncbi:MAG: PaaI family thioesterase [Gammaproteobacteria bacterium]|nr:PaaI family thioesterase [Gammaproteobacteria bacterium]